jgi:hypothetical protein
MPSCNLHTFGLRISQRPLFAELQKATLRRSDLQWDVFATHWDITHYRRDTLLIEPTIDVVYFCNDIGTCRGDINGTAEQVADRLYKHPARPWLALHNDLRGIPAEIFSQRGVVVRDFPNNDLAQFILRAYAWQEAARTRRNRENALAGTPAGYRAAESP